MVDYTAYLIFIWIAEYQDFLYINFIKVGRGHKIGQSVTRPLSFNINIYCMMALLVLLFTTISSFCLTLKPQSWPHVDKTY